MTDTASIPSCTVSYHRAKLSSPFRSLCSKPQMTTLMTGTAEQPIAVTSQSMDLNVIIKAFPVPLLEEAEGDALARDADAQPLQGLAPLLPCCMPPAQPSQFLQCSCWHPNFCNGFVGISMSAMVLLAFQVVQWFCWHWTLQLTPQNTASGLKTEHAEVEMTYLACRSSLVPVTIYVVYKCSVQS